jgi:molecular chaperone GrpE
MRKFSAPEEQTETAEQAESATSLDGQAEIEALTAERDQYLAQAQRALADFANFRRRSEQDRIQAREIATRGLLTHLVPIADELQRGLATMPEEEKGSAWAQGVQLIEKKLAALLEREGVAPIEAIGKPFDPAVHEAVATEEGSTQNVVVEVYQTGYKHGQGLLRPAVVKVGDKREYQA